MKSFIFSSTFLLFGMIAMAQNAIPVNWDFAVTPNEDATYTFKATAKMKGEWAIYSQNTGEGGPVPLAFSYDKGIKLVGETTEESEPIKKMSELFEVEVIKFKKEAVFTQKFKPTEGNSSIKGSLKFMCCNAIQCLPPTDVEFDVAF